jgi:hypothetical protein
MKREHTEPWRHQEEMAVSEQSEEGDRRSQLGEGRRRHPKG